MKPNFDNWLHTGRFKNKEDVPILVCIDSQPYWFAAGQQSDSSQDVDGFQDSSGQWWKIWGATGIPQRVSDAWVKGNWPDCYNRGEAYKRIDAGS